MNSSAAQWKSRRCELSLVAVVSHTAIFKISGSVEGRLISARLNWVVLCRIIWAHSRVWTSANVGLAWLDNRVLFSVSHSSLGTSRPTWAYCQGYDCGPWEQIQGAKPFLSLRICYGVQILLMKSKGCCHGKKEEYTLFPVGRIVMSHGKLYWYRGCYEKLMSMKN